jgi:hypothetical protein
VFLDYYLNDSGGYDVGRLPWLTLLMALLVAMGIGLWIVRARTTHRAARDIGAASQMQK